MFYVQAAGFSIFLKSYSKPALQFHNLTQQLSNLIETLIFFSKKFKKFEVQCCFLRQIMSNSNTLDFERYFIIEKTCKNRFTI